MAAGTAVDNNEPLQAVQIAARNDSSYALTADGKVWAWGNNASGQLGDGTNHDRHGPVQIPGLTGITAIAISSEGGAALDTDGNVWQ